MSSTGKIILSTCITANIARSRSDAVRVVLSAFTITWGWEGDAEVRPESNSVEVLLRAEAEGTVLQLRHTGLAEGASRVLHESGWTRFIDQLVTVAGAAA